MTLKAVLYDMNGVLVDDEPLHEAAFRKVLADLGADLDHAAYQRGERRGVPRISTTRR